MTTGRLGALLAALALPTAGAAQAIPRLDRLEVISSIWLQVQQHYVHWDRVTADWDSAYQATVIAAERGGSDIEFLSQLQRFTALLNSGDVLVTPPPAIARRLGRPPIRVRLLDGRPIVVQVQPTAETRMAGVMLGAEVVQVRAMAVERWLRDSVLPVIGASSAQARAAAAMEEMLAGERNTAIQLTLRGADGSPRGASLTRSVAAENRLVPADLRDGIAVRDSGGIRIVTLGTLDRDRVVRDLDQALMRGPPPAGVVLDLRDAVGGRRTLAVELAALLFDAPVETPALKHRIYWPLRATEAAADAWTWHLIAPDTVTPAPGAYGGPLVVLASPRTAGAAELFIAIVRLASRGVIVGETTAGASGPVASLELPRGWRLVVPVGTDVAPDASEVTATGIDPDQRVRQSIADLRSGHDAALARALELVAAPEPVRR